MFIFSALFTFIGSILKPRITLAAEVLALRQQLVVLQRSVKRPQLRRQDRFFWVALSQLWKGWREALIIVKPETVIKWHREGFRLYWRWKSKAPIGRSKINIEVQELIRRMSREPPWWERPGFNRSSACSASKSPKRLSRSIDQAHQAHVTNLEDLPH